MTITEVIEQIETVSSSVDELSHIPEDVKNSILLKLDELETILDEAAEQYGDEDLEDNGDKDDYGDE